MSDPLADVQEAVRRLYAAPMRPRVPVLSPSCGLRGGHAPGCRSAICECTCHWPPTG